MQIKISTTGTGRQMLNMEKVSMNTLSEVSTKAPLKMTTEMGLVFLHPEKWWPKKFRALGNKTSSKVLQRLCVEAQYSRVILSQTLNKEREY